ncbi:RxLR effector protein sfi6 [Phytophthora ramorum]
MRLFNTTLVVLAAVLLASGTAVAQADQASVSNVDVVHSSHVLAGEDKRFLRSHQTTDDEGTHPEHNEEERKFGDKLFTAMKQHHMQNDPNYRFKVFGRWKKYGYSAADVEKHVPNSLFDKYAAYRRIHG